MKGTALTDCKIMLGLLCLHKGHLSPHRENSHQHSKQKAESAEQDHDFGGAWLHLFSALVTKHDWKLFGCASVATIPSVPSKIAPWVLWLQLQFATLLSNCLQHHSKKALQEQKSCKANTPLWICALPSKAASCCSEKNRAQWLAVTLDVNCWARSGSPFSQGNNTSPCNHHNDPLPPHHPYSAILHCAVVQSSIVFMTFIRHCWWWQWIFVLGPSSSKDAIDDGCADSSLSSCCCNNPPLSSKLSPFLWD